MQTARCTCVSCTPAALRSRRHETNRWCCQPPHADLVEGKVNKGIYLKEEKDVMLLYYGRYQTSCINNPARCGPEGERVAPVAVS